MDRSHIYYFFATLDIQESLITHAPTSSIYTHTLTYTQACTHTLFHQQPQAKSGLITKTHTHTNTHTHIHTHTHTHKHTHTHTHTHTNTHTHTHTHIHTHTLPPKRKLQAKSGLIKGTDAKLGPKMKKFSRAMVRSSGFSTHTFCFNSSTVLVGSCSFFCLTQHRHISQVKAPLHKRKSLTVTRTYTQTTFLGPPLKMYAK